MEAIVLVLGPIVGMVWAWYFVDIIWKENQDEATTPKRKNKVSGKED